MGDVIYLGLTVAFFAATAALAAFADRIMPRPTREGGETGREGEGR